MKSKKYNSLSEWKKDNPKEYDKANRNGWTRDLCILNGWEVRVPRGYWTKERCLEDAKKYRNIKEWKSCKGGAYDIAKKKGWYQECIEHMEQLKVPNGYWTKERCIEEARKHKTRSEWNRAASSSVYNAKENGWYDECVEHMEILHKTWDKESIFAEAKKHKTRFEWSQANSHSYKSAKKNGWFDECVAHMDVVQKPLGYWTKERCIEEARKYKTQVDFRIGHASAYQAAYNNGWMVECKAHMTITIKPKGYWTKERCLEEANKYKNKSDWAKKSNGSYQAAVKYGHLKECVKHMDLLKKPVGYWTLEKCQAKAKLYDTKTKWQRGLDGASYTAAYKYGWFDECTKHMKSHGNKI